MVLADVLLVADPPGPQRRLLVVIDQFEELLTQTAPSERARFAKLLRSALAGPVQVVATLRPEFLSQLLTSTELAGLPTQIYTLRPLHREALRLVIDGPARLAGLDVGEHLVARPGRRHRDRGGAAAAGVHPGPARRRGRPWRAVVDRPL